MTILLGKLFSNYYDKLQNKLNLNPSKRYKKKIQVLKELYKKYTFFLDFSKSYKIFYFDKNLYYEYIEDNKYPFGIIYNKLNKNIIFIFVDIPLNDTPLNDNYKEHILNYITQKNLNFNTLFLINSDIMLNYTIDLPVDNVNYYMSYQLFESEESELIKLNNLIFENGITSKKIREFIATYRNKKERIIESSNNKKNQLLNYTGIRNLGNTCFYNATIQLLFSSDILRNFFNDKSMNNTLIKKTLYSGGKVLEEMYNLFYLYKQSYSSEKISIINPKYFNDTFCKYINTLTRINQPQQDAAECLNSFLSEFNDSNKELSNIYTYKRTESIRCLNCDTEKKIEVNDNILSLNLYIFNKLDTILPINATIFLNIDQINLIMNEINDKEKLIQLYISNNTEIINLINLLIESLKIVSEINNIFLNLNKNKFKIQNMLDDIKEKFKHVNIDNFIESKLLINFINELNKNTFKKYSQDVIIKINEIDNIINNINNINNKIKTENLMKIQTSVDNEKITKIINSFNKDKINSIIGAIKSNDLKSIKTVNGQIKLLNTEVSEINKNLNFLLKDVDINILLKMYFTEYVYLRCEICNSFNGVLDIENEYFNSVLSIFKKTINIESSDLLFIQLCRFLFEKNIGMKLNNKIKQTTYLDKINNKLYRLCAIIVHEGNSIDAGHYFTIKLEYGQDITYYKLDDTSIEKIKFNESWLEKNNYICLYEKL
jgi:ubiquitin C-terminal hydrolase